MPWCSTLTDEIGKHVNGQGKWGNCGPDCPLPVNGVPCTEKTFQCKSGKCIPAPWVLNGQNNCQNGSDEESKLR